MQRQINIASETNARRRLPRPLRALTCAAVTIGLGSAEATTFVVPLPVEGQYLSGQSRTIDFDLGVELTEIIDVRFLAEGHVTAGIGFHGRPFSWLFNARFDADPGFWYASGPFVGASTWPSPESFVADASFEPHIGATWEFLLDGAGEVHVQLPGVIGIPEEPPQVYPLGTIASASLVITAIEVCAEDLDDDGDVDFVDLLSVLGAWNDTDVAQDIDIDGTVGFTDLLRVLAAWGTCE